MNIRQSYVREKGFTLLEILLVIAAIGILAAIVIVAINPNRQLAQVRDTTRDSDVNSLQDALYQVLIDTGEYPNTISRTEAEVCATGGLSSTDALGGIDCTGLVDLRELVPTYLASIPVAPQSQGDETGYRVFTNNSQDRVFVQAETREVVDCPEGYIPVPGNLLYGTDDFCVMKYEAKVDDDGDGIGDTTQDSGDQTWPHDTHPPGSGGRTLVSSAQGYPLTVLTYPEAQAACNLVGAELISNEQWMTLARNIEGTDDNWTGGTVALGVLYRGHTDGVPGRPLEASDDDSLGYTGTGQSSPSEQRRTYTLSNGEVIWDLAGNVHHMVQAEIFSDTKPSIAGEVGVTRNSGVNWTQVVEFPADPYDYFRPSDPSWGNTQSMGSYFKGVSGDSNDYYMIRGGRWANGAQAGVYMTYINHQVTSGYENSAVGMRCAISL